MQSWPLHHPNPGYRIKIPTTSLAPNTPGTRGVNLDRAKINENSRTPKRRHHPKP